MDGEFAAPDHWTPDEGCNGGLSNRVRGVGRRASEASQTDRHRYSGTGEAVGCGRRSGDSGSASDLEVGLRWQTLPRFLEWGGRQKRLPQALRIRTAVRNGGTPAVS